MKVWKILSGIISCVVAIVVAIQAFTMDIIGGCRQQGGGAGGRLLQDKGRRGGDGVNVEKLIR